MKFEKLKKRQKNKGKKYKQEVPEVKSDKVTGKLEIT